MVLEGTYAYACSRNFCSAAFLYLIFIEICDKMQNVQYMNKNNLNQNHMKIIEIILY